MRFNERSAFERWIRSSGLMAFIYYLVGVGLYGVLEGWNIIDTIYFLTVTATTVGFGDISPDTSHGRLLTVVYAPFGTLVILNALLKPIGSVFVYLDRFNTLLLVMYDEVAAAVTPEWRQVRTLAKRRFHLRFTLRSLFGGKVEVDALHAYVHAFLSPLILVLLTASITYFAKNASVVDSL
jgi:hypothetical protein